MASKEEVIKITKYRGIFFTEYFYYYYYFWGQYNLISSTAKCNFIFRSKQVAAKRKLNLRACEDWEIDREVQDISLTASLKLVKIRIIDLYHEIMKRYFTNITLSDNDTSINLYLFSKYVGTSETCFSDKRTHLHVIFVTSPRFNPCCFVFAYLLSSKDILENAKKRFIFREYSCLQSEQNCHCHWSLLRYNSSMKFKREL